jgi:hypothetical protein
MICTNYKNSLSGSVICIPRSRRGAARQDGVTEDWNSDRLTRCAPVKQKRPHSNCSCAAWSACVRKNERSPVKF